MPPETETLAPETVTPAATGAAPAATEAPETVLANPPDNKEAPSDWVPDWREKMAAGDADELKALQRYKSPVDVNKARREAVKRISSGEMKAKLAPDATPEQLTAWRKDNGIPEKAEGYLEKLPDGLVIGDADKPMLASYLEKVHGKNASPEVVAETLNWYYGEQERLAAEQVKADKEYQKVSTDALREEWGPEFRANINSINAFLDTAPATDDGKPLRDLLMEARLGDGTKFGSNPAALKWLARLANEANPAGFVSPGDGRSQTESLETERDGLLAKMRTPSWAADKKSQDRFMQVTAALEKLKK